MRRTLLALTATGTLGLAACGSSSEGSGGPTDRARDDKAELAFARCMRENGVDIPDPGAGNGPQRIRLDPKISPQVVQRATRECRDRTGGGPQELTPEQREEFRDRALAFARCMRANGVDIPDPQVSGDGGVLMRRAARALDPSSPAFQRAEKACRDKLPGRPGGPGGGVEVQIEGGR